MDNFFFKYVCFYVGTIIIILTTFILIITIPDKISQLETLDDEFQEADRLKDFRYREIKDAEVQDTQATVIRSTLTLMTGMNIQNSNEYRQLSDKLKIVIVNGLIRMSNAVGIERPNNEAWKKMTMDQLQQEKLNLAIKWKESFEKLSANRIKANGAAETVRKFIKKITFWTGILQVVGLFLLAVSDFSFKMKEFQGEKKNVLLQAKKGKP